MRKLALVSVVVAVSAACSGTPTSPEYVVPLSSTAVETTSVKTSDPLSSTHLKGEHEVPRARDQCAGAGDPEGVR